jgi:hypothetical protein
MRLDDLADLAVPFRRVIFKEISPLIRFHCDARNHLKSGGNDLRERVCAWQVHAAHLSPPGW